MNKIQKFFSKALETLTGRSANTGESYSDSLDEPGYRLISQRDQKGLDVITRDRQLKIVFNLYLTNPFIKAMLDTQNDFVFGDGFKFSVEADDSVPKYKVDSARKECEDFWKTNKMDLKNEKKGIDLSLNGMLILPVFVNSVNGNVKLGFVDPTNLERVITDPLNIEDIRAVRLKQIMGNEIKEYKVIRIVEDNLTDDNYGLLDGETFYFAINNVSNQPEGVSDALVSADMADMLSQLLFNILKHSELSYLHFEDVKLVGADDKGIKAWKAANPISSQPGRRVHNENVEHQLITADIKSANSAEIVRLFKNILLLSKRMPEHWFADGGQANLATAIEQGTAVFRMLKTRQQYWVYIFEQILTFVLHQAVIHKKEGIRFNREDLINNKIRVKIGVPEFEIKNFDKVSDSVNKIIDFVKKAEESGYISHETAGKIIRSLTDMFGYDIDDADETAKILEEEKSKPEPIPVPEVIPETIPPEPAKTENV